MEESVNLLNDFNALKTVIDGNQSAFGDKSPTLIEKANTLFESLKASGVEFFYEGAKVNDPIDDETKSQIRDIKAEMKTLAPELGISLLDSTVCEIDHPRVVIMPGGVSDHDSVEHIQVQDMPIWDLKEYGDWPAIGKCSNTKVLIAFGTQANDADLGILDGLSKLRVLSLTETNVSRWPAALANCPDLTYCALSRTRLTDLPYKTIVETNPNLKELQLRGQRIPAETIAYLNEHLPECKIVI